MQVCSINAHGFDALCVLSLMRLLIVEPGSVLDGQMRVGEVVGMDGC